MFAVDKKYFTHVISRQSVVGFSFIIFCLLMAVSPFSWGSTSEPSYSLSVNVSDLRNSKGVVLFSLYNKEGSIPDEHYTNTYRQQQVKIEAGHAFVTFENLPKGRYAINILHDENQDQAIDKGFFLPTEGVGFSHYMSIGLQNRPNFKKASFMLDSDLTKQVKIIYF